VVHPQTIFRRGLGKIQTVRLATLAVAIGDQTC
jgi:hypothetical protein